MISCLSSCLFVCLSNKYTYLVFLYKKVLSNGWMDPIKDMFIYTYIHIKAKLSEILKGSSCIKLILIIANHSVLCLFVLTQNFYNLSFTIVKKLTTCVSQEKQPLHPESKHHKMATHMVWRLVTQGCRKNLRYRLYTLAIFNDWR